MIVEKLGERVERIDFHPPPEVEGTAVEFRLLYEGPLPSESGSDSRRAAKNAIRRAVHVQMAELWHQEAFKKSLYSFSIKQQSGPSAFQPEKIAENYKLANRANNIYRFVPLISDRFAIS